MWSLAHPAAGKRDKSIARKKETLFMLRYLDESSSNSGWKRLFCRE
jgi:hypothetical protein